MSRWSCRSAVLFGVLAVLTATAAEPESASRSAKLIDPAGNVVELGAVEFLEGTRPIGWIAERPAAIAFREMNSTVYKDGILTLVPLNRLEELEYGEKKQGKATVRTVKLKVAGVEQPLDGLGQFKGVNQFGIRGTVESKPLTYLAGSPKGDFQKLTMFGATDTAKPPSEGTVWTVTVDQARDGNPTFPISGLKVLYSSTKGEFATEALPLRGDQRLPLAEMKSLAMVAFNPTTKVTAVDIEPAEGTARTVVVAPSTMIEGQSATFLGFVGEVPAGWKLIPLSAIVKIERK